MFDSEILLGLSQCKGKQIFFRGGWGGGGGGILNRLHSADQTAQLSVTRNFSVFLVSLLDTGKNWAS